MKSNNAYSATLAVTVVIMVSKVVGFLREMVIAYYFGQSAAAAANVFAYGILSIFTLLFSAGISSTFIPVYTKLKQNKGESECNSYAGSILTIYIIAGLIIGFLGYLFAEPLVNFLWKGSEEARIISINQLKIMFPFIAFFAASGVLTNLLNARHKFIPEQLMGFALSFATIFVCIYFSTIRSVALATGLAGVIQIMILLPFLAKEFVYKPSLKMSSSVKRTFLLAIPALVSMAFDEVNHTIDRYIGSMISDASVVAQSNSFRIIMTVLGVLVVPITTIMFSKLSVYAARGDKKGIADGIVRSLELLALIVLPVVSLFVIGAEDVIRTLFQRGGFTYQNTLFTVPILQLYMLGVFTFGMRNFLVRVFYSTQDTQTPMRVGIIAVLINIVLNYTFALKLNMGAAGITLATSISGALAAFTLLALAGKRFTGIDWGELIVEFFKLIICTAAATCVMIVVFNCFERNASSLSAIAALCVTALSGFGCYIALALLFKVRSIFTAVSMFKK